MHIDLYTPADRCVWDELVSRSKNGTFLFMRGYMEYHQDRFADFSLVARDDSGQVLAVLPANRDGDRLISHGGLTYGGFVTDQRMKVAMMLDMFERVFVFAREHGIKSLLYKSIPHIYHRGPAEEDLYALFVSGAQLVRCDALSVVFQDQPFPWQERRRRMVRKAIRSGLEVKETDDLAQYWKILTANLLSRHGRQPVHTVDEMSMLRDRFPNNIKCYGSFERGEMLAGVVVYESARVAHIQYTAANDRGKQLGALDLLFDVLLSDCYRQKACVDFGISTENDGRHLNRGLMDQKEGFGGRLIVHNHYEIDLRLNDTGSRKESYHHVE